MPSGPEGPQGPREGIPNVHRLRSLTGAAAHGRFAGERTEPFPVEFVREALTLAEEIGVRPAAEQLGISPELLVRWKSKALRDYRDALAAAVEAGVQVQDLPRTPWVEIRTDVGDKIGSYANIIADQVVLAMLDGQAALVRAGAHAVGVFIDRAQMLTGGAQAKPLTREEREEKERRIIERLRRRAQAQLDQDETA